MTDQVPEWALMAAHQVFLLEKHVTVAEAAEIIAAAVPQSDSIPVPQDVLRQAIEAMEAADHTLTDFGADVAEPYQPATTVRLVRAALSELRRLTEERGK